MQCMARPANSFVLPPIGILLGKFVSISAMGFVALPSLSGDAHSSFARGIREIVGVRAEKEMLRIRAGRIIAMMTHKKSIRDWAVMNFP